jgi:hypothetical protein
MPVSLTHGTGKPLLVEEGGMDAWRIPNKGLNKFLGGVA